ncbi:hypothetical protein [Nocardioides sp.]|uniref:hypothetical protein n=1 Tax=Nocardioides sp. TaxID=35761 RepID=UPI002605F5AD|nr:hypothetical protein [Nocardioides sp.]
MTALALARLPRTARIRSRAALLVSALLVVVGAGLGPAVSRAEAIQFGGNASVTPNVGFGCEAGFRLADSAGNYGVFASGSPTCSYFQITPLSPANGAAPAPRGRATLVRVSTGDSPAPLRFTVMQARSGVDAQGNIIPNSTQCCFGDQMTRTFTFQPNTVTAVPLNLPMVNDTFPNQNIAITDYVGFSADAGTGALPLLVTSAPNPPNSADFAQGNNPGVTQLYPQIAPQDVRTDATSTPSIRLTTEFTFCTSGVGNSGRRTARLADLPSPCGGKIRSGSVNARRGKVTIPISCVGSCRGKLLVTKAKGKGKLAKTTSFSSRTGGKSKVTAKLTKAGKKATRGKRSTRAKVLLRTQGDRGTRTIRIR